MDREKPRGFLAIASIFTALGAVAIVLARLGFLSVSALVGYLFDAVTGIALVTVLAILISMYPDSPVVRFFHPKRTDVGPAGITDQVASIRIEPLPHYKGHTVFHEKRGRVKNRASLPDESSTRQSKTRQEAKGSTESQEWYVADRKVKALDYGNHVSYSTETTPRFYGKFGVVRVFADGCAALDCAASSRFTTIKDPSGVREAGQIVNVGDLDWFDKKLKVRFLKSRRLTRKLKLKPTSGLSEYTHNPRIDIHQGKWADLPLFYTLNNHKAIFLWGPHPGLNAATFDGNSQARFEIELSVSGLNFPKIEQTLLVTAQPDDFKITRIK